MLLAETTSEMLERNAITVGALVVLDAQSMLATNVVVETAYKVTLDTKSVVMG
jgi:hypothetical protein